MPEQLELRKVSVSYGGFAAVDKVSLNLQSGEIGCLLGPSGCGKTTLLRAIARRLASSRVITGHRAVARPITPHDAPSRAITLRCGCVFIGVSYS